MSKLTEIIKLLPKGILNVDRIISGLINDIKLENGTLDDEETLEILRRRIICNSCPLLSINATLNDSEYRKLFNEPFKTDRTSEFCTCCGCPKHTKTASLNSECGLADYNLTHLDNKQKPKWSVYKPTNNGTE